MSPLALAVAACALRGGARLCDFTFKCHLMIPDCVIVYPCVVSFSFYVHDEWSDCASVVSECVYISLGVS